jgi:GNAT superfamily N-acetyltransferase
MPHEAAQLAAPLTLRDGATVRMRAIRADDTERLRAFHSRLSSNTIYLRFFTPMPELSLPNAQRMTHVDYESRMALVATTGTSDDERIVAVVCYERLEPTVGEVAFVVDDQWQRRGIATALLHGLAQYARRHGFVQLVAQVTGCNTRMLSLLRHCGFPAVSYWADGLTEVRLDITQLPEPAYAK